MPQGTCFGGPWDGQSRSHPRTEMGVVEPDGDMPPAVMADQRPPPKFKTVGVYAHSGETWYWRPN